MNKIAVVLLASLQLLWWIPEGKAEAIVQKPEELRIPPVILLLEETPFYDSVENDYPNHPAGTISPQDVQVLEGQNGWASERNRWKIKTWLGEKWIVTEPGTFDVPPPERITLLEETPIYAAKNTKAEPSAVLSPQDVQVVGAEKKWFKTGKDSDLVWLKVSTTWLGDQWIQMPLGSIGYMQRVDRKEYMMNAEVYDSPPIRYLTAKQVGKVEDRNVQVNAEYVTSFGKAYRIATDIGDKWVNASGIEIRTTHEDVVLRAETPLFSTFTNTATQMGVIPRQSVTAFEKIGDDPLGINVWYHVRTPQGEGWINRTYGEPEDSVPIALDIRLHAQTTLYQYPNEQMMKRYDPLSAQTVRADAYWNDAFGRTWFRIQSYAGKVWFRPNPRLDKLTVPDGNPRAQIVFQYPRVLSYVQSDELLHDYNHVNVGFVREGLHYLAVAKVAEVFRYQMSSPDSEGYLTLTPETRYAFKIKEGTPSAMTMWNGHQERNVKLHASPLSVKGVLYLQADDVYTLFGAFAYKDDKVPVYQLVEKEYAVEAPEWPTQTTAKRLDIKAYLYDQAEKVASGEPKLYIYQRNLAGGELSTSTMTDTGIQLSEMKLSELASSTPLVSGSNELTAAVKVGERIVWKQDFTVTMK